MPGPRGLPGRNGHCEATCGNQLAYVWQPSREDEVKKRELRKRRKGKSSKSRKRKKNQSFINNLVSVDQGSLKIAENRTQRQLVGKKRHNS